MRFFCVAAALLVACSSSSDSSSTDGGNPDAFPTPEGDATLSGLQLSYYDFSQPFAPETTSYSATVSALATSVRFTATASDPNATLLIGGMPASSGALSPLIPLPGPTTTVVIEVTAPSGNIGRYAVTVSNTGPVVAGQFIVAPNPGDSDNFGWDVAVDDTGDWMAIAAPGDDSAAQGVSSTPATDDDAAGSGAVYIYNRVGDDWQFHSYLKASDNTALVRFGETVIMADDLLAVGAHQTSTSQPRAGAVYVFRRSGDAWTEEAILTGVDDPGEVFARRMAIDGNTMVVGADAWDGDGNVGPPASLLGAVHVFVHDGTNWSEQAVLRAPAPGGGDRFGFDVAIEGDTVVVGASQEDGPNNMIASQGAAYVYKRTGTTWDTGTLLRQPMPASSEFFGSSVAIEGDRIAVGSFDRGSGTGIDPADDNIGSANGAVHTFTLVADTWTPESYIKAEAVSDLDYFGGGIRLRDGRLVTSAALDDSCSPFAERAPNPHLGSNCGSVYVFQNRGAGWQYTDYVTGISPSDNDQFGGVFWGVDLGPDVIAVGAPLDDSVDSADPANNEGVDTGSVTLYH